MAEAVNISGNRNKIHPHKIALWIGFASIIMMFSGLTSAYVVRQAQGNWHEFRLPTVFFINTAVIVASSISLHLSLNAFKAGKEKAYKLLLVIASMLGVLFLILQYQGWVILANMGVIVNGNPADSFMYAIPGIHAAHVIGGIGALVLALIHAFSLPFKATPRRVLRLELTTQYWHFVDFLWVYLITFFVLQGS